MLNEMATTGNDIFQEPTTLSGFRLIRQRILVHLIQQQCTFLNHKLIQQLLVSDDSVRLA